MIKTSMMSCSINQICKTKLANTIKALKFWCIENINFKRRQFNITMYHVTDGSPYSSACLRVNCKGKDRNRDFFCASFKIDSECSKPLVRIQQTKFTQCTNNVTKPIP